MNDPLLYKLFTNLCMLLHVCIHIFQWIYIYIYTYEYICIYNIYIYIYIYIYIRLKMHCVMFLYFMGTIQLMHIQFFTDVLGITLQVTSLKNLLAASPFLLKAILRYLGVHFGIWSSISWEPFNCFTSNILQIFLVLPWG